MTAWAILYTRHCEPKAKQIQRAMGAGALDCFVAPLLAMTAWAILYTRHCEPKAKQSSARSWW
jgi:hypothetical protein